MSSTAPAATFAATSATPHDAEAGRLSEALARATREELLGALVVLNDDLLGTLSSYANAICQDRTIAAGAAA